MIAKKAALSLFRSGKMWIHFDSVSRKYYNNTINAVVSYQLVRFLETGEVRETDDSILFGFDHRPFTQRTLVYCI